MAKNNKKWTRIKPDTEIKIGMKLIHGPVSAPTWVGYVVGEREEYSGKFPVRLARIGGEVTLDTKWKGEGDYTFYYRRGKFGGSYYIENKQRPTIILSA